MTLQRVAVTPEVEALLALAMWPDPARVQTTLNTYARDPELQVWAWMQDHVPLAAAGIQVHGEAAEVLHLGTRPDVRGQGHAQRLLLGLMVRLNLSRLEAETDDDSAGFYRRAGFTLQAAAARGDRLRYRCTLIAAPLA